MDILVLTRVDETQMARLRELASTLQPKTKLIRGQAADGVSLERIRAVIGAPTAEVMANLHGVEWVQLRSDTLDNWHDSIRTLHAGGITVTRTRGSYDDTVPDHAMMLMLTLARDLPRLLRQRQRHVFEPAEVEPLVLSGASLLLIGLGSIGSLIAQRAAAFGMRITAVDPAPWEVPAVVEKVWSPDHLTEALAGADVIVAAVPLTDSTTNLLGAEALTHLKPGARLINVGRGAVVETDALLDALEDGRLAAAGLDVTDPWPLPDDHPLLEHPRVILTGHSAQRGSDYLNRQFEVIHENLRRYLSHEPLLYVVPPEEA